MNDMNREEIKNLLPVMQAFADGTPFGMEEENNNK